MERPFTLWGSFDIVEKGDEEETKKGRIRGIASSAAIDADGEVILQDGIDWTYFLTKGFISLEHPLGVHNIVGEPVGIERVNVGEHAATALDADLLLEDSAANQIYNKAQTLKKASSRRLGFSIEGRALERHGNVITKSKVMSVAISAVPKNPLTWFEPIMASMMYRAMVGAPGMVPGYGGTGDFTPLMPQSINGRKIDTATYPVNSLDEESVLVSRLLKKLPNMTWEQGLRAIKSFRKKD